MLVKFIGGPKGGQHQVVEDHLQEVRVAILDQPVYYRPDVAPDATVDWHCAIYKRTRITHGGAVYFTWQG